MPNLILIRHSQSQPEPGVPARLWALTEEGRRRCILLAERLAPYNLDVIITSMEPKAIETGDLVAQRLGILCRARENLHEQARETVPYFGMHKEFQEAVATLFSRPAELVFGEEMACEAHARFAGAIQSGLAEYPQENIAIVTHGTVLSLFASRYAGQDAFAFWQALGLPAYVVFDYPEMKLLAQANEII